MKRAFPILAILTGILLWYAMYMALSPNGAPTEQTMGNVQRIFYYHVPSAWTAFILFFINFGASIYYLIKRSPAADIVACMRRSRGRLLHRRPYHRADLGAPGLGHLVDLGHAPHLDARPLADLCELPVFTPFLFSGQTPLLAASLAVLARSAFPSFTSPSGSSAPSIPSRLWEAAGRSIPACCMCCCSTGWLFPASLFCSAGLAIASRNCNARWMKPTRCAH